MRDHGWWSGGEMGNCRQKLIELIIFSILLERSAGNRKDIDCRNLKLQNY